ncbi:AAA family ATPase [Acinetobacter bereziniae]|uniref:AAA family ATPase n=1 Tax=Acinetobacter bereziniae TaxID=106648 RepID=A0A8I1DHZ1_ACIBZ|nr:AAA family ATPase [Acinetobacter bereziniae]QQC83020.1 AAA family ATPase [Acinetobacter bereziniae]UUN96170.1 AAA family ATPase [Acinetobacter bereziniae]
MCAFKQLLDDQSISQTWIAKKLNFSPATINLIVKHGKYPKKNAAQIKQQIIDLLVSKGLTDKEILTAMSAVQLNSENDQASVVERTAAPHEEEQLMLLRKQTLSQEAKKIFKLFNNFFTDDIQDASELFSNPDINYVRESMWQAAKGNSTFIAVVGQSGSGKTTLHQEFMDRIEREKESVIVIKPHVLGSEADDIKGKTLKSGHIAEAILRAINPTIQIKRSAELRFQQVEQTLTESKRAGQHHVLLIEEAQSLPIQTLKHLKRFSELKNGFKPLLSIILIGQDELKHKLSETNPEIREVVQRCEIVTLEPFTQNSLIDYLAHRCKTNGRQLSEFIDQTGLDAICTRLTRNVGRNNQHESLLYPLAVGNLITGALNVAADLGESMVTGDLVMEV